MIKYTNISGKEYRKLSLQERKEKPYCIEYNAFVRDWKVNGKFHREDGPAIYYNNGNKYWYLNGKEYSFEEWCKKLNILDEEKVFLRLKYGN